MNSDTPGGGALQPGNDHAIEQPWDILRNAQIDMGSRAPGQLELRKPLSDHIHAILQPLLHACGRDIAFCDDLPALVDVGGTGYAERDALVIGRNTVGESVQ